MPWRLRRREVEEREHVKERERHRMYEEDRC